MRVLLSALLGCMAIAQLAGCNNQYLTGRYTRQSFADTVNWKDPLGTRTKPRFPEYVDSLTALQDSFDAKLIVGAWCNDSRRWVRRFFQLQAHMPLRHLDIVGVDTSKKDLVFQYHERYNFDSIPVFIFFRQDEEIGRIKVKPHKPRRSMERDIWHIVKP